MGFTSFSGSENFSLGATAVIKMGISFEIVNMAGIWGGSRLVILHWGRFGSVWRHYWLSQYEKS